MRLRRRDGLRSASCSAGGCSSSARSAARLAVIGLVFEYYRGDTGPLQLSADFVIADRPCCRLPIVMPGEQSDWVGVYLVRRACRRAERGVCRRSRSGTTGDGARHSARRRRCAVLVTAATAALALVTGCSSTGSPSDARRPGCRRRGAAHGLQGDRRAAAHQRLGRRPGRPTRHGDARASGKLTSVAVVDAKGRTVAGRAVGRRHHAGPPPGRSARQRTTASSRPGRRRRRAWAPRAAGSSPPSPTEASSTTSISPLTGSDGRRRHADHRPVQQAPSRDRAAVEQGARRHQPQAGRGRLELDLRHRGALPAEELLAGDDKVTARRAAAGRRRRARASGASRTARSRFQHRLARW